MTSSRRAVQILGRVAVVLCLAVAGTAVTTGPANAWAYKCAQTHGAAGNHTCLEVKGSGLYVKEIYIDHSHISPSVSFCNYQGKFWGTSKSGGKWTKVSAKTSGCTIAGFYVKMSISRNFKNGTKVYGQAAHNGSWAPGKPAATIKK